MLTRAKFHFNRLMVTLIFVIRASEPSPGPSKRLKKPSLMGLRCFTQLHCILDMCFPILQRLSESLSHTLTDKFILFGLTRLAWICNRSTDSETLLKVMRDGKFSQETNLSENNFFLIVKKKLKIFSRLGP